MAGVWMLPQCLLLIVRPLQAGLAEIQFGDQPLVVFTYSPGGWNPKSLQGAGIWAFGGGPALVQLTPQPSVNSVAICSE